MTTDNEFRFISLCYCGQLTIAKSFLQKNPDINISTCDESAFCRACMNGRLEVCQWLLSVKPDINIAAQKNWAFRYACVGGHLEVCKWLYSLKADIAYNDNWAFRYALSSKQYIIGDWFQSINPYLYVINYGEDGSYKDYLIRSVEEERWEKRKLLVWLASDLTPDKNNLFYRIPQDVSRYIIQML
jgi:hypothetical protein